MGKPDAFPGRQLRSLCAAALLCPCTRLIPGAAAELGGRAAWLGPLLALPALLLYAWLLSRLRAALEPGESLPELCLRLLGRRIGRGLLLLLGLWLLLYCSFVLRSGAERLLVTVYPRSGPGGFVICLAAAALLAALGPLRSLLRLGRMAEPVLLAVLLLILISAFRGLDATELLPLDPMALSALLAAALPALDLLSFALMLLCLFPPGREAGGFRRTGLWTAGLALLLTALGAAVQGRFGAALSARLAAPFFALVRNLVFFHSLERVEALVVGLWLLPDFLLSSLCLQGSQRCLRLALGFSPREGEGRLELDGGRWLIWLAGAAAPALALVPGSDPAELLFWSRRLIPALQMTLALLLPAGLLLAARRHRKKG